MGEDDEKERLISFFQKHEDLYERLAEVLMEAVEAGDNWELVAHANHLGEIVTQALNMRLFIEREAKGMKDAEFN